MNFETWLFDILELEEAPFLNDESQVIPHFIYLNENIGSLVAEWGEEAMAQAIWSAYGMGTWNGIFNGPYTSVHHQLLHSLKNLYLRGFEPYCSEHYGNQGPQPPKPMNAPCYMLWDMGGIECMARPGSPMIDVIFDTLRFILAMGHGACQHSALHGLGHLACSLSHKTTPLLEEYLSGKNIPEALRTYARSAMSGCVL